MRLGRSSISRALLPPCLCFPTPPALRPSTGITLNSNLNITGGAASAASTGATNLAGNITGPGLLVVTNGRVNITGSISNSAGLFVGVLGNTAIVNFAGTGSGDGPIVINGADSRSGISYSSQSNLTSGPIYVLNGQGAASPTIRILNNSTINNTVNLLNPALPNGNAAGNVGDVFVDVAAGVTGTWAGTLNGAGRLTKTNTGTLVLSNNANTQTGGVTVNAGTLAVNGILPTSANAVTVNNGGTLGGSGTIFRTVTVASGGSLAPGNSPGQLTIDGNLTLSPNALYKLELNGTTIRAQYDSTTIAGSSRTVTLTNSILSATTTSNSLLTTDKMFVMVLSDSASSFGGTTFAGIAQDGLVFITPTAGGYDYSAQVSYTGDSDTGASWVATILSFTISLLCREPTTVAFLGLLGAGATGGWYYRRRRLLKQWDDSIC